MMAFQRAERKVTMATRHDEIEVMRWFVLHMLHNLDLAAGQGGKERLGWRNLNARRLFTDLTGEVSELGDALLYTTDLQQVISEAADVANFAMMVADTAGKMLSEREVKQDAEQIDPYGGGK